MSKLSIVATPIGNLEDITLRALRVLKEADVVFCEDTRVTGKLLSHYDIHTKTMRCDAHKEAVCANAVIARLEEGENVAYVTDAGTPGMSDPGAYLVSRVRDALPNATIEAIPGASSLTAALSIAGITEHSFRFLGFLPHKKGRQTLFKEIAAAEEPVIFLESTHRIIKTLESLCEFAPEKKMTLCRELTKKFEEVVIGTPAEVLAVLSTDPNHQKGEFVVIVKK
jgi:16S rRNA (cytidine1402-2'-O)-methyltransferase